MHVCVTKYKPFVNSNPLLQTESKESGLERQFMLIKVVVTAAWSCFCIFALRYGQNDQGGKLSSQQSTVLQPPLGKVDKTVCIAETSSNTQCFLLLPPPPACPPTAQFRKVLVQPGEGAREVCNDGGVSLNQTSVHRTWEYRT